jgi:hypothetical protein
VCFSSAAKIALINGAIKPRPNAEICSRRENAQLLAFGLGMWHWHQLHMRCAAFAERWCSLHYSNHETQSEESEIQNTFATVTTDLPHITLYLQSRQNILDSFQAEVVSQF